MAQDKRLLPDKHWDEELKNPSEIRLSIDTYLKRCQARKQEPDPKHLADLRANLKIAILQRLDLQNIKRQEAIDKLEANVK